MTITPINPAPTGLAGDLDAGAEALALAVTSMEDDDGETEAFTRVAVSVKSKEAVDRRAAKWGVPARWSEKRTMYVARKFLGDRSAEVEVVYHVPQPEATASETAA